jgi:hypothetical protein
VDLRLATSVHLACYFPHSTNSSCSNHIPHFALSIELYAIRCPCVICARADHSLGTDAYRGSYVHADYIRHDAAWTNYAETYPRAWSTCSLLLLVLDMTSKSCKYT